MYSWSKDFIITVYNNLVIAQAINKLLSARCK